MVCVASSFKFISNSCIFFAGVYNKWSYSCLALGITPRGDGSSLWREIALAATSPHAVAGAHILGLPARHSCLFNTNATGKACGLYKRVNRGAVDGTFVGVKSKNLSPGSGCPRSARQSLALRGPPLPGGKFLRCCADGGAVHSAAVDTFVQSAGLSSGVGVEQA